MDQDKQLQKAAFQQMTNIVGNAYSRYNNENKSIIAGLSVTSV